MYRKSRALLSKPRTKSMGWVVIAAKLLALPPNQKGYLICGAFCFWATFLGFATEAASFSDCIVAVIFVRRYVHIDFFMCKY